ncbi:MAG: HAD-IA family hydrolase [Lachnospiraceae bacterium]|nr:HAD-IA family hydrolase [Lachnospiraceae bacterium]
MSTKAVIFDLDDTLVSEISYCISGYREASGYIAEKLLPERDAGDIFDELLRLFNQDHKNVFNRFLINNIRSDEQVMELVETYRKHFPNISYFDDVRPCLNCLKERGIKTGILSDGYAVTQRQKIRALNAEKDFDIIVLTDEIGREAWKPDPAGFRLIEEKLGVKASETVYVGDNPEKDFYLSVTAGIKTVRIIRENGVYNDREYLNGVKEDLRIGSLQELTSVIL